MNFKHVQIFCSWSWIPVSITVGFLDIIYPLCSALCSLIPAESSGCGIKYRRERLRSQGGHWQRTEAVLTKIVYNT